MPLLPPGPAPFIASLPGGGVVELNGRETLGFSTILNGGFETAEIERAIDLATAGEAAFDVGANVGVYTVAIARAADNGVVVAVEPDTVTIGRLTANLARNSLDNVLVVEAVANESDGTAELHIADDAAYSSIGKIEAGHHTVGSRLVTSVRLDTLWADLGRPAVSIVKIDVEGAEVCVIRGARDMLTSEHPALLLEANSREHLDLLEAELRPLGYRENPEPDFAPWNHLFIWSGDS
jgi:FkbM family methyltransferase